MTASPIPPPPPPPPPALPTGWIDLTIQGNRFFSGLVVPSAHLNGYPVATRYGRNVYPVPPGPWRIDLAAQWWKRYGEATLVCEVPEGRTVPVFYAAPPHVFAKGNIGHTKQPIPGLWFYWVMGAMLAVPVLLIVLVALLA